jgi:hypothetical protein
LCEAVSCGDRQQHLCCCKHIKHGTTTQHQHSLWIERKSSVQPTVRGCAQRAK